MYPRHTDVINPNVTLMSSSNSKLLLIIVHHNHMHLSTRILLIPDRLQDYIRSLTRWLLILNHVPPLALVVEGIWERLLAQLTFILFPGAGGGLPQSLRQNLRIQPLLETLEMDAPDRPGALAGIKHRV